MKFEQFIADSMKRVSVFDLSNNDLLFMATQIQDGSLSGTVDQQEITGMNGIVTRGSTAARARPSHGQTA